METFNHINGKVYRIDYRKIRITGIKDFRDLKKVLVEGFIRLANRSRINLRGFIPYGEIADEARGLGEGAYVTTNDKAIAIIEGIILKLPVGLSRFEMTIFEQNMLRAVARTLVLANSTVLLSNESSLSEAELAMMNRVRENGYVQVSVPLYELAQGLGISYDECKNDIISQKLITITAADDGTEIVTASADMGTQYYSITEPPKRNGGDEDEEDDLSYGAVS